MYSLMQSPVDMLPGIGKTIAGRMKKRGMGGVGALLLHLPKTYVDDRVCIAIDDLAAGVEARTQGRIVDVQAHGRGRMQQVTVWITDDHGGQLQLRFFRSPFLLRDARLKVGREIMVRGKPEWWHGSCQMLHPQWQPKEIYQGGWQAVYASVAGLSGQRVAGLIQRALTMIPASAKSPFDQFLDAYPSMREALNLIHLPHGDAPDDVQMQQAVERLLLEELLTYLHLMRDARQRVQVAAPMYTSFSLSEPFIQLLPYSLTPAQQQAWADICADLASGRRMHRLVQGDVGSGKTWVAILAMLMAVAHGDQAALMAPTEVLARQHRETLQNLLEPLGLNVVFLSGSTPASRRKKILSDLADGSISLIVGTHALISDDVKFARLGLAVVDEQHRFGVRQRWALAMRGDAVHVLAMTATPIPRSLALALYGDMDLTWMKGMPQGRSPVQTSVVGQRAKLQAGMRRILGQGGRIYWIVPRIDDEEDGVSVVQRADVLQQYFPDMSVLALHGRMKSKEKTATLEAFAHGQCRILVSTTVVEVGVDVPEARLIVIEQAEQYGLAQLHQLRGRVGRSAEQGFCVLLPSNQASEAASRRLTHLSRMHDGMELAEMDMKLRGAGDALGARQSGGVDFRLLDIARDAALVRSWHDRLPDVRPTDKMIHFWRPMRTDVD